MGAGDFPLSQVPVVVGHQLLQFDEFGVLVNQEGVDGGEVEGGFGGRVLVAD
jgi:hypothetical protein